MAVNLTPPNPELIYPVAGVKLGIAQAGIKKANKDDFTLIELVEGSISCGVFTKNRFCAAPVQVCQKHLAQTHEVRALVINTGNANAGTGAKGLEVAQSSCVAAAELLGVEVNQVLPFSTGVIMEPLALNKLITALPIAHQESSEAGWVRAAGAIMTTDTIPKALSKRVEVDGYVLTITGISKGSGMIRPNMATMLGYIATDVKITAEVLQILTTRVADESFNCITVDGDTSTNDSFVVMATQQYSGMVITDADSPQAELFYSALKEVAQTLAQAIVRDGEGATKFIAITVEGGRSEEECRKVAYSVAHSPLVKTAFFASDPNFGRILAAVGYAGIDDLDQNLIELHLGDTHVVSKGARLESYKESDGQRVMQEAEISINIGLARGNATATVWTCDFSHEYVTINADYRS